MRIFVTGATGFIGSAIVAELLQAGHSVLGLARNDAAAAKVSAAGAQPHHGDLEDHASLRAGATACDAVIHTGFVHDFARFKEVCEIDRRAIAAFGEALAGTAKPLLVASGTAVTGSGQIIRETSRTTQTPDQMPRVATELAGDALAERGIRVGLLRFPPTVHGDGDHGFIKILIDLARAKGVAAYIGDGRNRWPAVHRRDAAVVARLAIASAFAPGTRFHAVAEEGVPFRQIAEAIGRGLGVPVESRSQEQAASHFGWFAHFAALDAPASSQRTREVLGWKPTYAELLPDIAASYFKA